MRFLSILTIALLAIPAVAMADNEATEAAQTVVAAADDADVASLNEITPAAGADVSDGESQLDNDLFAEPETHPSRRDFGQEVYFE